MRFSRILLGVSILAIPVVLAVPLAVAQSGGSTKGSTTGSTGSSSSRSRTSTTTGSTTGSQLPEFREARRPIFLQGTVVLNDGTPTPPNIVIERVCGGQRIPEGHTDSKGRFHFEVGRSQNLVVDASTSGTGSSNVNAPGSFGRGFNTPANSGVTQSDLIGCMLRAVHPGYISSTVVISGHRLFDNPDVGTIILRKLGERSGFVTSVNSLQAPKAAKKAFQKAAKHAQKQKWDKAEQEFRKAIEIYPEYAEAWYILGQVKEAQQKPEEARAAYGKALTVDPKFFQPHMKLAMMDARQNKWQDVVQTTDKVLQANPYEFPNAYVLNSMANLTLNNNPAAEKSAREVIKMDLAKRYPQVEQILGLALANQDNFEEASAHLQKYLELAPNSPDAPTVREQLAQVESLRAQHSSTAVPAQAASSGQAATPQQ